MQLIGPPLDEHTRTSQGSVRATVAQEGDSLVLREVIRIEPLAHAWKVEPPSALIGIITFVATLVMAPALADGILVGVSLTVLWYLIRTMRPRAEIVARKPDGTLGGIRTGG